MANTLERRKCTKCGALNPPGTNRCLKCSTPFEDAKKPEVTEAEIDELLSDIFKGETLQAPGSDTDKVEDIGLELSPDAIVEPEPQLEPSQEARPEDLLESLLLESSKEKVAEAEVFECPLCSAVVSVDATVCPSCGAPFVDTEEGASEVSTTPELTMDEGELESLLDEASQEPASAEPELDIPLELEEEVAPAPSQPAPKRQAPPKRDQFVETPPSKPQAPVSRPPAAPPQHQPRPDAQPRPAPAKKEMEVSEPTVPVLSRFGTRLVDISLAGTVLIMVIIFAAGGLWVWDSWSPLWAVLLFAVGGIGFAATYSLHLFGNSFIVKGDQLYLEGKYAEALEQYERAVRFGSRTSSSAWTNRGNCYRHLGYVREALRSHEIALKIDQKDEIAWANKGAALLSLGDVDGALDAYDMALKLKPNYVVALNNKGVALANANELENALLHFKRAVEIQPRYRAAWVNLAEGFSRLGRGDESQQCLSVAHRMA